MQWLKNFPFPNQKHGRECQHGAQVCIYNGESDYVHMLLELNPKITLSTFINNLKTVSSRYIRKDFKLHLEKFYFDNPIFWSRSYCILTCGGAPLAVIKQYIEQQAEVD